MTSVAGMDMAGLQQQVRVRLKEGVLIALAAVCIYLWLVLLSFDAGDPGFSSAVRQTTEISNAGGRLGAWLADVLLSILGYFAWLLPLVLMLKVVLVFQLRYQPLGWQPAVLLARLLGLVLVLVAGAGLSALHFGTPEVRPENFNILGVELVKPLLAWLGIEGSTLVLLASFMFGVTLFTNLSWFRMMELLGEGTLWLVTALAGLVRAAGSRSAAPAGHPESGQAPAVAEPVPARQAAPVMAVPLVTETVTDAGLRAAATPAPRTERHEPVIAGGPIEPVIGLEMEPDFADEFDEPLFVTPDPVIPAVPPVVQPVAPVPAVHAAPAVPVILPTAPVLPPPVEYQPPVHVVDDSLLGSLPPLSLLDRPLAKQQSYSEESLQNMSRLLEVKLKEFGVEVQVESVHPGPVVTRFEIELAPGVKVSRITNLAKDLARSMAMISVRVVEVIPGKTTVGIEVPNEDRQIVRFSEVLETSAFDEAKSVVTLGLGHDIGGQPVIADLAKMPHLLVAGTTGSGKSVGVNAMILSMLFKSPPEDVRLIMIDPKMLELSIYEGIPHLLCPVVTDMKEAANALRWCVAEMERRYKLMSKVGVRNLAGYNRKVLDAQLAGAPLADPLFVRESPDDVPPALDKLPTIVVVVDEFADMMMIVGKKVEELIARIAQKARAAGIHLILATQRPSVDVITGLIKANIPTRMAFQVSSKIDSRTILDQGGAEQLLGHGDMLYLPPGTSLPVRVHGAFVSDDEVHRVVDAWKARGAPDYIEAILAGVEEEGSGFGGGESGSEGSSEDDPLFDEAVRFVTETRRVSISSVQRKLKVGYNRAANIVDAMEAAGVISSAGHNGSREVLAPPPVRD
ncbi:MAG: cell division protein FtsK [Gammaproteobacteria bacterium]|nr:cell division protein FtsK [Gammaproteobacteria bacterium]